MVNVNPEDIESIFIKNSLSILYNSEVVNSVVMITTKSGREAQGIEVEFNTNISADYVPIYHIIKRILGQALSLKIDAIQVVTSMVDINVLIEIVIYKTHFMQLPPTTDGTSVLHYNGINPTFFGYK